MIWIIQNRKYIIYKRLGDVSRCNESLIYRDFGMKHSIDKYYRKNGRVKNIKRW